MYNSVFYTDNTFINCLYEICRLNRFMSKYLEIILIIIKCYLILIKPNDTYGRTVAFDLNIISKLKHCSSVLNLDLYIFNKQRKGHLRKYSFELKVSVFIVLLRLFNVKFLSSSLGSLNNVNTHMTVFRKSTFYILTILTDD